MKRTHHEKITGRQLAAARVLAGLDMRALGKLARMSPATITRLEAMNEIVTGNYKDGFVRPATLSKIVAALNDCGVRLCSEHHGVHLR